MKTKREPALLVFVKIREDIAHEGLNIVGSYLLIVRETEYVLSKLCLQPLCIESGAFNS